MERRNFLLGGLALLVAAPKAAIAQVGWRLLGSRIVRGTVSRDNITVTRNVTPISQLSFRTRSGEVQITDIQVIFTRGRSERITTRVIARPNTQSMPIRLRSRDRTIRRVEFNYRRARTNKPTTETIELHGRR